MTTYLVLSIVVLSIITVVVRDGLPTIQEDGGRKPLLMAAAALLVLTAIFDNLIIKAGIVAYDMSRISGLLIGDAPVEDFAYSIGAVLLVPYIWKKCGTTKDRP